VSPDNPAAVSPYTELPAEGPYEVAIGTALITMVEPHVGHDRAYNRWYEDDHFFSGAMAMPWMFAGRRWVATRDLQALRYPSDSSVAQPVELGKYISLYWITEGRHQDHERWTVATNVRLRADGRIHMERDHIFTAFQSYRGAVYRDDGVPRDIHSLHYPFGGLVVEVIDAPDGPGREVLLAWLEQTYVPSVLAGSPVGECLIFEPMPLPADKMEYAPDVEGADRRLTLLWFTEGDPRDTWEESFAGSGKAVEQAGLGRVELVAPFIPTVPGTDRYVDELR
jgi:hypothetical protein